MAEYAPGLASHQFGNVRVFLLRHDRRTGTEGIRQVDESKLRGCPEHQLFRETRQMHHDQAGAGREFDGEIPITDSIQRVGSGTVKTQQAGGIDAIQREGGAGERRGTQGHHIYPFAAIAKSVVVAFEHFKPGQHVVTKTHRLGDLQMREARHDGIGFGLGKIQQGVLQAPDQQADAIKFVAQIQSDIGSDLVIAGAACVQLLADFSDPLCQPCLNVHVHIFELHRPLELAAHYFREYFVKAIDDEVTLRVGKDADFGEHGGVCLGSLNVMLGEPLIEVHRSGEGFNKFIGRLREAPGPGFLFAAHQCTDRKVQRVL